VADLGTLIPAGASGLALVAVIGYLLKSNAADRKDYQGLVDRADNRTDAMSLRFAASEVSVDAERVIRRRIEDALATVQRQLADLQVVVDRQTEVIATMRKATGV
jgi:hypothetical protein